MLDAALALCRRDGYPQVTLKGIADAAGVGRQTIYRWWSAKSEVLLEALRDFAARHVPPEDTGDALTDVETLLRITFATLRETTAPALVGLLAEAQHDPDLSERLQATMIGPRRQALHEVLRRGVDRGQLVPRVSLTLAVDMVFGVMWYRLLHRHAPVDDALVGELVAALVRLLGPDERPG
ncbi:transcriptional regulator, TetR family [Goodfellowiella coeruleoviolacea]|uniref:Transcriptional regulator, TetR family n=1 Tax=Goodfellowiella coeruleoviolacea TaxID=334858 RepID=A0AAE3KJG7_9PSEU|nr:transcriptional regulator, TetR family [Goodfellowiella coeruleoviolacea]